MSHAPQNLGYFETIQMYFLEVTGRGIMFTGRDLEALSRWRAEGASTKTVCLGIEQAVASMPDDDPPRDIFACRAWVEAQLDGARERSTGEHADVGKPERPPAEQANHTENADDGTASLFDEALSNIERAGRDCDDERRRQVYRNAWRDVRELVEDSSVDDPFAELAAIEDALVDAYFRALDRAEQDRIEDAISEQNRADLAIMSPEARQEHLAARRRRLLIQEYGLAPLID
ncbi:MAG: hypothetical protein ACLFVJ_16775 [Persicimonas sp.]